MFESMPDSLSDRIWSGYGRSQDAENRDEATANSWYALCLEGDVGHAKSRVHSRLRALLSSDRSSGNPRSARW